MSFPRLTSLLILPVILLSAGCDFYFGPDSTDLRAMKQNVENIKDLIAEAADGNVYQNEDLDLDVMASEVKKLNKSYANITEDEEKPTALTLYTSANLFFLFETFERYYYQSEPEKMLDTKGDVLEFLLDENLQDWVNERGGQDTVDALMDEMDNFITIEQKYLDPSVTSAQFQEYFNKASSENLFNLFYTFIDQTVLFGDQGVQLAGYGKQIGEN